MHRLLSQGKPVSPLFSAPGMAAQLCPCLAAHNGSGVSQLVLGNLCWFALQKLEGSTRKRQVAKVWEHMRADYTRSKCKDRLSCLKLTMVKQQGKSPRMRGKAGEVRALVPFGAEPAAMSFVMEDVFEQSMIIASMELRQLYQSLEHVDAAAMGQASRRLAALLVLLEEIQGPL